jgi:protein-disulfide isomerase
VILHENLAERNMLTLNMLLGGTPTFIINGDLGEV